MREGHLEGGRRDLGAPELRGEPGRLQLAVRLVGGRAGEDRVDRLVEGRQRDRRTRTGARAQAGQQPPDEGDLALEAEGRGGRAVRWQARGRTDAGADRPYRLEIAGELQQDGTDDWRLRAGRLTWPETGMAVRLSGEGTWGGQRAGVSRVGERIRTRWWPYDYRIYVAEF